jgi:periplasmic divalent cation tolerance protein
VSTPAIVLTTMPADADHESFARALVEGRLAACVNILPEMRSIYRWQGHVEDAREHQMIIKTTRERLGALEERIRALHPYEVPEFIVVSVAGGSDDYLGWISDSTAD